MTGKTILGAIVAGLVLFVFGFLYWGLNPIPYGTLNEVTDVAGVQATAAKLFPESGLYLIPGPGNDEAAVKLLETGPSLFVAVDHTPVAGADPMNFAMGFVHNVFSALLMVFILQTASTFGGRVSRGIIFGIVAAFVINGSEIIWWQQPFNWVMHQVFYYIIYFAIGSAVLHFFIPPGPPKVPVT